VELQRGLAEVAREEQGRTGEYIRPIVLVQAEPNRSGRETLTTDIVRKMLIEDCNVPDDAIAIATGSERGIEGVNVLAKDCPLTFIITVRALTEGWVYVLSVTTPTWFKVDVTGGSASVAANSHFLGSGGMVELSPTGASLFVHIIKDTGAADGRASLSKVVLP